MPHAVRRARKVNDRTKRRSRRSGINALSASSGRAPSGTPVRPPASTATWHEGFAERQIGSDQPSARRWRSRAASRPLASARCGMVVRPCRSSPQAQDQEVWARTPVFVVRMPGIAREVLLTCQGRHRAAIGACPRTKTAASGLRFCADEERGKGCQSDETNGAAEDESSAGATDGGARVSAIDNRAQNHGGRRRANWPSDDEAQGEGHGLTIERKRSPGQAAGRADTRSGGSAPFKRERSRWSIS